MNLDALAGNAHLKEHLTAQARRRGLGHAYLISGPAGSGKRTLARLMAAAMVCSAPGEKPCGVCPGCKKALGGGHPDVTWAGGDGKSISVGQVRELRSAAYIRPNEAPRRVFILPDAQDMNANAQNALLKLLEEGPAYAAFLLLTQNPGAVLPTIRSRCESLALSPLTPAQAEDYLRKRFPQAAPETLYTAARRCGGALGSVIPMLEGGEAADSAQDTGARLLELIALGDELSLAAWTVTLEKWSRDALTGMMTSALTLLRDALAVSAEADALTDGSRERSAVRAASALPPAQLLRCAELLEQLITDAAFNVGAGHLSGALAAGIMEVRHD